MLKEEMSKVFRSNKSKLLFVYLMVVAISDNVIGLLQTKQNGALFGIHPAYISLLSGQSGKICYALYIWIMPLTISLLYCNRFIQETRSNIISLYLSKSGRRNIFFSKMTVSFILPSIFFGIPLLINLFIYYIFLNGSTSFLGWEDMRVNDIGEYLYLCIHNPYLAWVGYYIIALIIFGMLGILCQSICMIFKESKMSFIVSFSIWISLFCSKYDITMIIQPFTEYDYTFALKALLMFIPLVIIAVVVSFYLMVVKKDVI